MRIISKHHDYYDDMAYVYGVDERLQLIRPMVITDKKETNWTGNKNTKVEKIGLNLHAFNFRYPSIHNAIINGVDYYYGKFNFRLFCFFGRFCIKYTAKNNVEFEISQEDKTINAAHLLLKAPVFEIHTIGWHKSYCKNQFGEYSKNGIVLEIFNTIPTLKSTGVEKAVSAEEMYSIAEQWVRSQKTNEELIKLNNTERIVKAGFDLKESFRPNLY